MQERGGLGLGGAGGQANSQCTPLGRPPRPLWSSPAWPTCSVPTACGGGGRLPCWFPEARRVRRQESQQPTPSPWQLTAYPPPTETGTVNTKGSSVCFTDAPPPHFGGKGRRQPRIKLQPEPPLRIRGSPRHTPSAHNSPQLMCYSQDWKEGAAGEHSGRGEGQVLWCSPSPPAHDPGSPLYSMSSLRLPQPTPFLQLRWSASPAPLISIYWATAVCQALCWALGHNGG